MTVEKVEWSNLEMFQKVWIYFVVVEIVVVVVVEVFHEERVGVVVIVNFFDYFFVKIFLQNKQLDFDFEVKMWYL